MKPQAFGSGFRFASIGLLALLCCTTGLIGYAGIGGGFRQNAVGGVMISAEGLVRAATPADRQALLNRLRAEVENPAGELEEATDLRMVSLRKLQEAMRAAKQEGRELSDAMRYMAGLVRVEYVFVYPEQNDIVLAGPAEPWIIRDDATVVGARSGQPTLLLEDLVVAMRSVESARPTGGIRCSIEPTAQGVQRLNALLRRVQLRPGQNPKQLEPAMREAYGPQVVRLEGVAKDSRFARVLVAADFEMKRLAMALTASPINDLPSYMEMARNQRQSAATNPRWWMTTNYEALQRTEDRLAWHLRGQGVKTMTETDQKAADGTLQATDRKNKTAQAWADKMTEKFSELSREQAVFGELRNLIDLSVIATLIQQERLDQRAGCDLAVLMGTEDLLQLSRFQAPTAIEPQCSFIRGKQGWVVSASGGVAVNSFQVVENQQTDAQLGIPREQHAAAAEQTRWWWNS